MACIPCRWPLALRNADLIGAGIAIGIGVDKSNPRYLNYLFQIVSILIATPTPITDPKDECQSSTCTPSSTTRLVGRPKKAAALWALRARRVKMRRCQ